LARAAARVRDLRERERERVWNTKDVTNTKVIYRQLSLQLDKGEIT
jgi:hypothetical protein